MAEKIGRVDIVINNVEIVINAPTFDVTDEAWQRTLDIHRASAPDGSDRKPLRDTPPVDATASCRLVVFM